VTAASGGTARYALRDSSINRGDYAWLGTTQRHALRDSSMKGDYAWLWNGTLRPA